MPNIQCLFSTFSQACIAWGQIRGREDYMDNTLLRIESKARDTVKLIALLRHNGVDVAQVEEAIKQVKIQKARLYFTKKLCSSNTVNIGDLNSAQVWYLDSVLNVGYLFEAF